VKEIVKYKGKKNGEWYDNILYYDDEKKRFILVNPKSGKKVDITENIGSFVSFTLELESDNIRIEGSREEAFEKIRKIVLSNIEEELKKILGVKRIEEVKTWKYYDENLEEYYSAFGMFNGGGWVYYYKIKTDRGTFIIRDIPDYVDVEYGWAKWNDGWEIYKKEEVEDIGKIEQLVSDYIEWKNRKFQICSKEEVKKALKKVKKTILGEPIETPRMDVW